MSLKTYGVRATGSGGLRRPPSPKNNDKYQSVSMRQRIAVQPLREMPFGMEFDNNLWTFFAADSGFLHWRLTKHLFSRRQNEKYS
jgi:hypothetical protein